MRSRAFTKFDLKMTEKGLKVKHKVGDRITKLKILAYLGKAPIKNINYKSGYILTPCYEVLCDCGRKDQVTQEYLRYKDRVQQCRVCSKKKEQHPWRVSGRSWREAKDVKEKANATSTTQKIYRERERSKQSARESNEDAYTSSAT